MRQHSCLILTCQISSDDGVEIVDVDGVDDGVAEGTNVGEDGDWRLGVVDVQAEFDNVTVDQPVDGGLSDQRRVLCGENKYGRLGQISVAGRPPCVRRSNYGVGTSPWMYN
ncbi:hypothetical protein [Mycobacteroides abscessus]|uniref:hypothetical protein n=1 Tax=Mycobacteroides abscessus TaxID=36809 RepID=UPI001F3239B8|nr:hypothetical protein [Mycobacteroides abscessus]